MEIPRSVVRYFLGMTRSDDAPNSTLRYKPMVTFVHCHAAKEAKACASASFICLFRATPHNSARKLSERFCASSKFQKRGNTVCISRFWNCRNGAKDPLRSADTIVRCCLILNSIFSQDYGASGRPPPTNSFLGYQLS